jgi:hypothetical protein
MSLGSVTRPTRWLGVLVAVVLAAGLLVVLPPSARAAVTSGGTIPVQKWGSAAGRSHEATADATSGPDSGEHSADPAPGGLPSDGGHEEAIPESGAASGSATRTATQATLIQALAVLDGTHVLYLEKVAGQVGVHTLRRWVAGFR